MKEEQSGPAELGAPMDYREHERTYDMFVAGAKYGTIVIAALLIGMAALFFGHAGYLGGIAVFLILSILGCFMAR